MKQVVFVFSIILSLVVLISCNTEVNAPIDTDPAEELQSTHSGALDGSAVTSHRYIAVMSGADNVPPIETDARAVARFKRSADGLSMQYKIKVADMVDITLAHAHPGAPGINGAPIVNLYSGPTIPGSFTGVLVEGMFTEADLIGDLASMTLNDFVDMVDANEVYINVHNLANPAGEIRGQVTPAP